MITVASTGAEPAEKKISRRRFIKIAGSLAAAGALVGSPGAFAGPKHSAQGAARPKELTGAKGSTLEVGLEEYSRGTPPVLHGFSIFWITDTQFLSERNSGLFKMMTKWIVRNWAAYNGKLVIHTGDLVQSGDTKYQWENARDAMHILLQNGIPYTWCAGNHDDLVMGDQFSGWVGNKYGAPSFNPMAVGAIVNGGNYPIGADSESQSPKTNRARWVGDYNNGRNTAISFTANGLNFLVVNLEWNAPVTAIQWAESLLNDSRYLNHNVILAPHAYINAHGQWFDPSQGPTMSDFLSNFISFLNRHPNVFLTLSGHFGTDSGYFTTSPLRGRNQLMFDRQDCTDHPMDPTGVGVNVADDRTNNRDRVGGATVTILNFDTDNNKIHVSTHDVFTGQWRTDYGNQYSVVLFPNGPQTGRAAAGPDSEAIAENLV